jgi:hypothetical protein
MAIRVTNGPAPRGEHDSRSTSVLTQQLQHECRRVACSENHAARLVKSDQVFTMVRMRVPQENSCSCDRFQQSQRVLRDLR